MKRILQRIWFWIPFGCICYVILSLLAFATGEVRQIPKLQKRLDALTNTFDPIHATNGLVLPEGDFIVTNYCATNLTNYWFETERQINQWYNSNYTTVEWVGKIVTADTSDPYRNPFSYLRDCELGLRSDGMVVWREKK